MGLRLRILALLLAVSVVAAWPYPSGNQPDNADGARRGEQSPLPGFSVAHPSSPQNEFDPDLLRSLLAKIESEASSHPHVAFQGDGHYYPNVNQPSSLYQASQHGFGSLSRDKGQVGSSQARESFSDTQGLSSSAEPAFKYRKTVQRVADALRQFQANNRLDGAQALRDIIQRHPQLDTTSGSQSQGFRNNFGAAPSVPSRESQGGTIHHGPGDTKVVDIPSDRIEAQTTAEESHESQPLAGHGDGRYRSLPASRADELRKIPTTMLALPPPSRTRYIYDQVDDPAIRDNINNQVFAGKLVWIDRARIPASRIVSSRKQMFRPHRVLPMTNFPEIHLSDGKGSIKDVRFTFHGGGSYRLMSWPEGYNLVEGQNYLAFWGIPEGRQTGRPMLMQNYGYAFLPPQHRLEVNEHLWALKKEIADKASEATWMHA